MSNNLPQVVLSDDTPHSVLSDYLVQMEQTLKFAAIIKKGGLCPESLDSVERVYSAILYGAELKFSPIQAVNSIQIIKGKACLPADTIKALILSKGAKVPTIKWDDTTCHLRMTRGDWTEEYEFTMEYAKRAGFVSKNPNYNTQPRQMLYARCVTILAKNMYADVLKGVDSVEAMQDADVITVSSTPAKTLDALLSTPKVEALPAPEKPAESQPAAELSCADKAWKLIDVLEKKGKVPTADIEKWCSLYAGSRIPDDFCEADVAKLKEHYSLIKAGKASFASLLAPIDDLTEEV
jgi:hypothetical protein